MKCRELTGRDERIVADVGVLVGVVGPRTGGLLVAESAGHALGDGRARVGTDCRRAETGQLRSERPVDEVRSRRNRGQLEAAEVALAQASLEQRAHEPD